MRRQLTYVCGLFLTLSFIQLHMPAFCAGKASGTAGGAAKKQHTAVHSSTTKETKPNSKAKPQNKSKSEPELEPKWYGVTEGFEYARKKKKMIVCDFYTDWCGWCKVLDQTTYRDPAVLSAFKKNFVAIKVNAEDGGAGQELAEKVGVRGFPTIMFIGVNANPVYGFTGYRPAKKFLQIMDAVVAGKSKEDIDALDVPEPGPGDQETTTPQ